jgi:hypothetical protein
MRNKYTVIDNFLNKEDFITLKNSIINKEFSWYFQDLINNNHSKDDLTCYFTHLIYEHTPNSSIYPMVFNLFFNKLKMKSLLNTCDGFTSLDDGTKIESIENRLLLFDSNKPHASSTCTNAKARFNMNFNYF